MIKKDNDMNYAFDRGTRAVMLVTQELRSSTSEVAASELRKS